MPALEALDLGEVLRVHAHEHGGILVLAGLDDELAPKIQADQRRHRLHARHPAHVAHGRIGDAGDSAAAGARAIIRIHLDQAQVGALLERLHLRLLRARAQRQRDHDGRCADHHAQHGQQRAQPAPLQVLQAQQQNVSPSHRLQAP